MEKRKLGSCREDVYIARFVLALVTFAIVALAIVELAVALNTEFTRTLVGKAMWAGSLMWIAMAVSGWWDRFKNKNSPLWLCAFFTIGATSSVAGMYTPTFTTFALWANVAISLLFSAVIAMVFPQTWRNCATTPA
jgi:hypothetical protein